MTVASPIDGHGRPTRVRLLVRALLLLGVLCWPVEAAAQPGTSVLLTVNQGIHSAGTTIDLGLGLHHAGPPVQVDLFFGVVLPDGQTIVSFEAPAVPRAGRLSDLRTLRPLVTGLTVGPVDVVVPSFFEYAFQGHEPLGTYKFFFAAVRTGAFADGRIDAGDVFAARLTDVLVTLPAAVAVDGLRTATATVPLTGGTVTTTGADGTVYTLTVPAGALEAPTAISLTPVSSLTSPLPGVRNVLAVRAAPEGLAFRLPATLTIDPAGSAPSGFTAGLSTTGAGAGFEALPAGRASDGTIVILGIEHFSVLGAAFPATVEELGALYVFGSEGPFIDRANSSRAASDTAGIAQAFSDWHAALITPQVSAAGADEFALLSAMQNYLVWDGWRQLFGGISALEPTAVQSKTALANALRSALEQRLSACGAQPSLLNAEVVMRLQNVAREYFNALQFEGLAPDIIPVPVPLHGDLRDLDLASVLARLCVRVEILSTTFPSTMQSGVVAPLTVRAGLVIGTAPASFTRPLQVAVNATGVTPAQRTGTIDATGQFQTTFTATANSATFDILAALVDSEFPFLSLAPLSATTRLVRTGGGVVVTPPQTSIQLGASRQFSANQTVTWTVNAGGSVTPSGLFTSNGTNGTFFVTATSVADPSDVGVAQVTVGSTPSTGIRVTASASASGSTFNCQSSGPLNGALLPATLTLTCSDGAFALTVNVQRAGSTVTFGVTATVPPGPGQLINYGGTLLIEPTATGTLTVTAHPGWRQGIGDVNYAVRAEPAAGASVVSNFDFRNGSVFASTGPASLQVTGTGADHAVSVSFSMFCNGSCSGSGTQFTIALP